MHSRWFGIRYIFEEPAPHEGIGSSSRVDGGSLRSPPFDVRKDRPDRLMRSGLFEDVSDPTSATCIAWISASAIPRPVK